MGPIVSMFDESGLMVRPWAERGFQCFCFDIVNDGRVEDFASGGRITFVEADLMPQPWNLPGSTNAAIEAIIAMNPLFVFGFGPCTELATCGAKHFDKKRAIDPDFQARAVALWRTTETVGQRTGAAWFAENLRSVLSTQYRRPDFKFDPSDFGGYLPEDDVNPLYPDIIPPRDAYTKKLGFGTVTALSYRRSARSPIAGIIPDGRTLAVSPNVQSVLDRRRRAVGQLPFSSQTGPLNNSFDNPSKSSYSTYIETERTSYAYLRICPSYGSWLDRCRLAGDRRCRGSQRSLRKGNRDDRSGAMNRLRSTFSTLAPWQIEVCLGVLVVTFVGALALAYAFKKWNRRNALLED